MSMIGMWDGWWDGSPGSPYGLGESTTMSIAAAWLDEVCADVEDWGCGSAHAKQFFKAAYRGVDGSGPKADVIADLREYTSSVDGILMRHVLEHNVEWPRVLSNALRSARKRLALILFTPYMPSTRQLRWNAMRPAGSDIGVPDIGFAPTDLLTVIGDGWAVRETEHKTATVYGAETILYIERQR